MVVSVYQCALCMAQAMGRSVVEPDVFVGDSSNTISYLEGTAKFKARNVSAWVGRIREALAVSGREVEFRLVPRAMNQAADELATMATTMEVPVARCHDDGRMLSSTAGRSGQGVVAREGLLAMERVE